MGQLAAWPGIAIGWLVLSSPLSAQEPKLRSTLHGHTDEIRCVAVSPDGSTLASGSGDAIRFWDVASGKALATLENVADFGIECVTFSPDGKTLAVGAGGNKIKLLDVGTRKVTTLLDDVSQFASPLVVFSSDGKTLASGGQCIHELKLWDVTTGRSTATLKGYDAYGVRALVFTPDGKTLVAMGHHDGLKRWDVATGKPAPDPPPPEAAPKLIARLGAPDYRSREQASNELTRFGIPVLPLLREAAKSKNEPEVQRRLELLVRQIENTTLISADGIHCAAFSPDGKTLATATGDGNFKLWDVATGKEQATLDGHAPDVRIAIFSPDGKSLASGSANGKIRLWDVGRSKELATLKGHTAKVNSLAFSVDGKLLVSASADKSIKLWDVTRTK
ncbi:MAG TPA: WD40 repeat domain-containing protein [Gemmataceae bacterium]|nr:WD40 repeat domain-containing protein [Gemmataceae bacterium]